MAARFAGGVLIDVERLHPSEYGALKDVHDGFVPSVENSIVVVAKNGVQIIGRIFLVAPAHVEAIHIEEAWRNGPVMKMLVEAIELEAKVEGIKTLFCYAKDKQMESYISRLGYEKSPMTVWKKELV